MKYCHHVDTAILQSAPSSGGKIEVKIDYSEVTNLNSTYSNRIEDWKKKLTEKDGIILELRKKITELEAEIEKLKSELVSKSI